MVADIYFQPTFGIIKATERLNIIYITPTTISNTQVISRQILPNSSADLKTSTSIKANRLRAQRHSRTIRLQVTKYLCRNNEQEKPTSIRRFRRSDTSLCAPSVACSSFAQSSQVYVLMISGLQSRCS